MNPFTQATVARPCAVPRWLRAASLAALLFTASGAQALDLNTATQAQLVALRGIGPKTAQTIIAERQRGGRYQSLQDLSDRVRGIGAKKARALQKAGLTVGGANPVLMPPG